MVDLLAGLQAEPLAPRHRRFRAPRSAGALLRIMSSECGVVCSTICWMRPLRIDEHHVERDVGVLHPHADRRCGFRARTTCRAGRGSERTNMRPWACRCGVSASHTSKRVFYLLAVADLELCRSETPRGPRAAPICATRLRQHCQRQHAAAHAGASGAEVKVVAASGHGGHRRSNSTRPAKSKLVRSTRSSRDRLVAGPRQKPRATTRYTARPGPSVFDAFLGQRIHRALVVALGREDALFAFEQDGDIGAQRLAAASFADARDAEDQAHAAAVAARRPADADAHASCPRAAARPRIASRAFFQFEVEVERAAHARAQVTAAGGEAAAVVSAGSAAGFAGGAAMATCQRMTASRPAAATHAR